MADELDGLLGRVEDPALRPDPRAHIDRIRAKRTFGLVFESRRGLRNFAGRMSARTLTGRVESRSCHTTQTSHRVSPLGDSHDWLARSRLLLAYPTSRLPR
jgi:hypothetical protein